MKKTICLIGMAAVAASMLACSGSDDPDPIQGDGDGTGGAAGPGTGGGTGTGGGDGQGSGGAASATQADFVVGGRGTIMGDPTWDGYLFTVAGDMSTIMPAEFTGSELCVSGTLGASYEEWALVGWNIAQEIDPDTFEGGAVNAIAPGGTGVSVQVVNNGGSGLRVQIQSDDQATESWCAPVPAAGGVIPWSSFTKECWAPGGEAYDGVTPIAQVAVQTYAGSDTQPTVFDYCVLHLGPG